MTHPRIILVEDDVDLAAELAFNLREEGIETAVAHSAGELGTLLTQGGPRIIVLDVGLPDEDGLSVARKLALNPNLRIIMLTARVAEHERIAGFEAGADVYMSKPVNVLELAAVIRRTHARLQPPPDEWVLDSANARLTAPGGQAVALTTQELQLLQLLQSAPEQLLSRDALECALWGESDPYTHRRLEVLVHRLREKIGTAAPVPELPLRTLRLRGYQFCATLAR